MVDNRISNVLIQFSGLTCDTKASICHAPPCTTRNLRKFIRRKWSHAAPIKFAERGKGNVMYIKVQPHANRVSRHQIFHITILIKLDLGIARAGTKCSQNNRSASFLTA